MDSNAIVSMTGPPLLGIFANWSLFGVISSQVYIYSQAFPNDRRAIKVLVYGVYTLNIIQTSFLTETSWTMFASGYGNIKNLDKLGTSWLSVGVIGGIVELLVQLFYVYRIFVLSQSMVVTASILFVSISSFAAAIFNSVFAAKVGHLSALVARTSPTYVSTGVSNHSDILISITTYQCLLHFPSVGHAGRWLCLRCFNFNLPVLLCQY
ncbi:hypothetical protein BDN70DRAFT_857685 [Pholiota conissans]|uniref:Uncharacterized protein n=1 Tax=Pholiota conissans TaxID=109636 RepID=A0A9P6D166_9AGAR|nr:hypothetical protein BDN70DRAFT_857685 [Pholiota conissans]